MKKQPKQERSQAIVESILEAATRVLSISKLSQMTTNKLADVAGVSIGSLYDYFPNKNDIVVTLMDKRMQAHLDRFFLSLDSQDSVEGLIQVTLDMIRDEYIAKKQFLREVFILAPESGRMEALFLNRIKAQKGFENFLINKVGKEKHWAEKKSFIITHAIIGAIETFIIVDDMSFSGDEFLEEMRKLMEGFMLVSE
ncbi:MAG: TetR/AcrR family transcriptional regulator [Pseudobdellovibrio sp.]